MTVFEFLKNNLKNVIETGKETPTNYGIIRCMDENGNELSLVISGEKIFYTKLVENEWLSF